MLKKTVDLIMASDKGEAHLVFGAPKEDSLGKSRAEFPQLTGLAMAGC